MNKKKVISNINPLVFKGVAHRGLHNQDVMENSLKAFELAVQNNVAIELDIHLTKDNQLVVIHDEDLKRLTGKEGIVEHLTLKELEQYKLLDGQKIPLFSEVIDLVNEQVPILVELKVYEKNYKALSKKVKEEFLPKVRDKKNYVFISFDPRSLWPLKSSKIMRLLLVAKSHEYTFNYFRWTVEGVDLDKELFVEPRIQKYHKRHLVNVWTIEKEEQIKNLLPYIDTVTYQFIDPKVVSDILQKK